MAELLVFLQFGRNLCAASCEIVRSEVCNIVPKGLQICFVPRRNKTGLKRCVAAKNTSYWQIFLPRRNKIGLKRCVAIIEVRVVHGNGLFVLFMMQKSVNYIEI